MKLNDTDTTEVKRGRRPYELPKGVKVDWSLPNRIIATQLKVSPMQILLLRRRMGKQPLPQGRPEKTQEVKALRAMLEKVHREMLKKLDEVALR